MLNGYKIRDWAYLLLRGRETIAERKRVKGTLRRAGLVSDQTAVNQLTQFFAEKNVNVVVKFLAE